MRSKVDAIDYKYFVEPNIPKFRITKELLDEVRSKIPVLAHERKEKYINEYGLSEYDAGVLTKDKKISDYFEECVSLKCDPKSACNWITTRVLGELNKSEENNIDEALKEIKKVRIYILLYLKIKTSLRLLKRSFRC